MYLNTNCRTKEGTKRQTDAQTAEFIRTVLEQDRHVKALHQEEILSTAENPRIRDQNDTTDISEELKALRHDEFVRHKRRQQLRVNNHELRQLELQLRAAVTSKQLAEQLNYIEESKKQVELQKQKENQEFEKERLKNLELQMEEEKKERAKRTEFRAQLLDQIKGLKQKRVEEYTEVMRDRENMQNMLKQFDIERENERKEMEKRKKETHHMMETFLQENAEFKKEMQLKNRADDTNMLKLLEERELERQRLKEERRQEQEKAAALSNRIGQQLYQTVEEKRKRENLLVDLLVEERNAKEDMRYRNELEKREEQRMQMRGELERYLREVKEYNSQTQKMEEESWLEESREIDAKLEKQVKQKEEEKLKRKLDYQKGILQLIEERRMLRVLSADEERNLCKQLIQEQLELDQEVQRERINLLKSCSPDLFRYLPSGVLKESDRQFLASSSRK